MDDLVTAAQQNVGEEAATYAVAHAAIPTMHQAGGTDDTTMKQPSVVTHSQHQTPSRSKKTQKIKFPPPSNEIIFGHNENDVLLGRGATTNIHPGNITLRNLCGAVKPTFSAATNAEKRQIAINTAQHIMALDPPGRFLERVEGEITIHEDGSGTFNGMGGAYSNVDVHTLISPSDAKYLNETGWAQNKVGKHWRKALGPWRDVGMEKAVQKTCAVIRDHNRQDRIALKSMGLLKKNNKKATLLGYPTQVQPGEVQAIPPPHPADVGSGVIPTHNDIIIGRGAFINSHPGNIQFRAYCYERKERFDASTPAEKRAFALEVIDLVTRLDPPARFLKRDPRALQQAVPTGDGNYRLPPRGLEGPWEEVSGDKACAKTIQVLRDLKMREEPPAAMPTGHEMPSAHLLMPPQVDNGMAYQAYEQPINLTQLQEPDEREIESLSQTDSQFRV